MEGSGIGPDLGTPEPASHRERRASTSSLLPNSASFHHTQQSSVRAQCLPLVEKLIGHARAQEVGQPELLSAAAAMISSLLMELEAVADAEASRERAIVKPSAWAQREAKYKQDLFELRRTITLQEEAAARLRDELAVYRRTSGNAVDGNGTQGFEVYDGRPSNEASPMYAYKRGSLGRSYRYQEPALLEPQPDHHKTLVVQANEPAQTPQQQPQQQVANTTVKHEQLDSSQLDSHHSDPIASKVYEPQRLTEERTAPFSLSPAPDTHHDNNANGLARVSRGWSRRATSDAVVPTSVGGRDADTQAALQHQVPDQPTDNGSTQQDSLLTMNGTAKSNSSSSFAHDQETVQGNLTVNGGADVGKPLRNGIETEGKAVAQVASLQTELESAKQAAEAAIANESAIKAELHSSQKQFMEDLQEAKQAAELAANNEATAHTELEALQQRLVTELEQANQAAELAANKEASARKEMEAMQQRLVTELQEAKQSAELAANNEASARKELEAMQQRLVTELQEAKQAAELAANNEATARKELEALQQRLVTELQEAKQAAELAANNEASARKELEAMQQRLVTELQEAKQAAELAANNEATARKELEALQQRLVTELQEAKSAAESAAERERAARIELQLLQDRLALEQASVANTAASNAQTEAQIVEKKLLAELQIARTAAETAIANGAAVKSELQTLQERLTVEVNAAVAATRTAEVNEAALRTELEAQREKLSRDVQDAKDIAAAAVANEAILQAELQSLLARLQAAESTAADARSAESALQNELALTKEQQAAAMSELESLRAQLSSLNATVNEQQQQVQISTSSTSEMADTGTETQKTETDMTSQAMSQTAGVGSDVIDSAAPGNDDVGPETADQGTTNRQNQSEDDVLAARFSEVEQLVEQKSKEAHEARQHAAAAAEALEALQAQLSSSQAALAAAQQQLVELSERESAAQRELQAFEDTMAGLRVAVEEADMRRQVQEAQNIEMAEQLAVLTEFVSYKAKNPKHANTLFSGWLKRRPSQQQAAGSQGSGQQQGLSRMSISSSHPTNAAG